VELIQAAPPQAKDRTERANRTPRNRPIKEIRLPGASDTAGAQALADEFIEPWNAKFTRAALNSADAHRPWRKDAEALGEAPARREPRALSKVQTFSVASKMCRVKTNGPGTAPPHFHDGGFRVEDKNHGPP